jgi:hypothetical protein
VPQDARDPGSGLVLRPFRATRYGPAVAEDLGAVTSPPYDVIDEETVGRLYASHPYNVVRLILPRRFAQAPSYDGVLRLLGQWRSSGVLVEDPEPALYVYEYVVDGTRVRGLVGALGLRDRASGTVLPHEEVMPGPVADRAELITRTDTNLEPILLVYDGGGPASDVADAAAAAEPLLSCVAPDGSSHTVWRVTDGEALRTVAEDLAPRRALIADGHHRYAAYQRVQSAGAGSPDLDFGLALLVDQQRYPLQLGPIHRVVSGLGLDELVRLSRAASDGPNRPTRRSGRWRRPHPTRRHSCAPTVSGGPWSGRRARATRSTRTCCTSGCCRRGASGRRRCTTCTTRSTRCRRRRATPAWPCWCAPRRCPRWLRRRSRAAACRASRRRSAPSRGWAC